MTVDLLVGVVEVEGVALVLGNEDAPEPALGENGQRPLIRDGGFAQRAVSRLLNVVELAVQVIMGKVWDVAAQ